MPAQVTIVGIILLTGFVNLFVGSASAKWVLLAPIFVPMLMGLGISPELTQAAYRVGDSTTNIITPLMPYFPLVVVFCQRYVRSTGIGTLVSLMLPFSLVFQTAWTLFLLAYWQLGIPLGLDAPYTYPPWRGAEAPKGAALRQAARFAHEPFRKSLPCSGFSGSRETPAPRAPGVWARCADRACTMWGCLERFPLVPSTRAWYFSQREGRWLPTRWICERACWRTGTRA